MNPHQILRLFPNASKSLLKVNAHDYGTHDQTDNSRTVAKLEHPAGDEPLADRVLFLVELDRQLDNVSEMQRQSYTEEENERITGFYKANEGRGIDLDEVAKLIGRSRWSVAMQASRLGLCDRHREKTDAAKKKMSIAQVKAAKSPESFKRRSDATKKGQAAHGHPRGFLGKKRTHEELAKMQAGATAAHNDKLHRVNSPLYRQRLSDLASMAASLRSGENQYSRVKSGWVEVGGRRFFARSKWEANYGRYLQFLKEHHQISEWEHEPETFWFERIKRGVRSYLPDFRVTQSGGYVEYHEVKGWMDARSKTKIKRMKKYYPNVLLIIRDAPWFKANSKQLKQAIPEWQ